MSDTYFTRPLEEYKPMVNPVRDYHKQASFYISKKLNITLQEAEQHVKEVLNLNFQNPKVTFRERKENGDRHYVDGNLLSYITYATNDKINILVPSGTVYDNHNVEESQYVSYIANNKKVRSKYKKLAFKYKMEEKKNLALLYENLQKNKKTFNNSLSGAFGSSGTPLCNISAHYSLTSGTRCVASYGNGLVESMVAGNRHYRNPDITLNNIVSLIVNTDLNKVKLVVEKYSLYIPSVKDCMDMILSNTINYWESAEVMSTIQDYVSKCDDIERCAIMYVLDLNNLKKYNDNLFRNLFGSMLNFATKNKSNVSRDEIYGFDEYLISIAHHINSDVLKGKGTNYKDMDNETWSKLLSCCETSNDIYRDYADLFQAFFVTDNTIPSIFYFPNMLREVTVLSDTDSTCATYQDWVMWYFNELRFDAQSVGLVACVMNIVTQTLKHILALFSANTGVKGKYIRELEMKNEYYWPVFIPMNGSKHYIADVLIREMNVFLNPETEMKGSNILASGIESALRDKSRKLFREIFEVIKNKEKVNIVNLAMSIKELELGIIESIHKGETTYLSTKDVKELASYTSELARSPYLHHIFWQDTFSKKYGESDKPPYNTLNIPTTLTKPAQVKEWLDTFTDLTLKQDIEKYMKQFNKTALGTIRVPLNVVYKDGIPKELLSIINVDKVIKSNLTPFYFVLEALGYFLKPDERLYHKLN